LNIYKTKIKGLILLKYKKYFDQRGGFFEAYNEKSYSKIGINKKFVQDNISFSKKNVLRGLHYQKSNPQGKLITVIKGSILDVVVDLRKKSTTFGNYSKFFLSEKNCKQLWIPENFAHGFLTLSPNTVVNYKCTKLYDPNDQNTIIWNDKDLDIDWNIKKPILSKKDKQGVFFKDIF
jgi:dTDP-4-dehydrorhamnose 3,5-epimerase